MQMVTVSRHRQCDVHDILINGALVEFSKKARWIFVLQAENKKTAQRAGYYIFGVL